MTDQPPRRRLGPGPFFLAGVALVLLGTLVLVRAAEQSDRLSALAVAGLVLVFAAVGCTLTGIVRIFTHHD